MGKEREKTCGCLTHNFLLLYLLYWFSLRWYNENAYSNIGKNNIQLNDFAYFKIGKKPILTYAFSFSCFLCAIALCNASAVSSLSTVSIKS